MEESLKIQLLDKKSELNGFGQKLDNLRGSL
jgi:hypothetical protein